MKLIDLFNELRKLIDEIQFLYEFVLHDMTKESIVFNYTDGNNILHTQLVKHYNDLLDIRVGKANEKTE